MARKQKENAKIVKVNTKTVNVNKNMTFADVLTKYPESWEVMQNCGLHCIGCHGAAFETIEQGSLMHGMSEKDIDKMVDEINKKIDNKIDGSKGSKATTTKKETSAKPKKTERKK